jgi:adenylate cyclase
LKANRTVLEGQKIEIWTRTVCGSITRRHMRLVAVLPHLGRIEEARAEIPIVPKLKPEMSVNEYDRFMKMLCLEADFRDRVTTALRLAGFREEADESRVPQADAAGSNSQH